MTASAVLMAAGALVDQTMAAMLAPGGVAALEYGNRIVAVVTGLGTTTLGVAVVPYFSQLSARADWPMLAHVVKVAQLQTLIALQIPFHVATPRLSSERHSCASVDLAFECHAESHSERRAHSSV